MLCFSAMKIQALRKCNLEADSQSLNRIGSFINEEIRSLNSEHLLDPFKQVSAFTTVADQALYSMSPSCKNLTAVWDTDIKYQQRKFEDLVHDYPELSDSGSPTYYALRELDTSNNQQIYLYPVPDTAFAFSCAYYTIKTELTNDNDYLIVPPEFEQMQDILTTGAARSMLLALGRDLGAYDRMNNEYKRLKKELDKAIEGKADGDNAFSWGEMTDASKEWLWYVK